VLAIEAGCAAVRINPGNIKKHDKVALLGQLADEAGVAIRIGVNGGSLEDEVLARYGGRATPEAMVESAMNEVRLLEEAQIHPPPPAIDAAAAAAARGRGRGGGEDGADEGDAPQLVSDHAPHP
jgi:hypothetical protein